MELPAEVIAEIQANRKVNAIKLLREQQGIDLKEAKQIVDDYIKENPPISGPSTKNPDGGFSRILLLIVGVSALYALYKFLS